MILGKITAKAQITIPHAVRAALGLKPGDEVSWKIEGDQVVMARVRNAGDPFIGNLDPFSEVGKRSGLRCIR